MGPNKTITDCMLALPSGWFVIRLHCIEWPSSDSQATQTIKSLPSRSHWLLTTLTWILQTVTNKSCLLASLAYKHLHGLAPRSSHGFVFLSHLSLQVACVKLLVPRLLTSAMGSRAFCSSGRASCTSLSNAVWNLSLTVSSWRTCSDLCRLFLCVVATCAQWQYLLFVYRQDNRETNRQMEVERPAFEQN